MVEEAIDHARRTVVLILLVLALGLGAYIYFVESKKDVDAAAKKDKVFTVEPGKIDEIEVHAAAGDVTRLKKTGTNWQIVAPVTASADQGAASSMASTLESIEVDKSLDDNPKSVADYGLDPPRFSVSFKAGGDGRHKLDVGSKTPTGADLYARIEGQPRLFLVAAFNEDAINRTTFDLRDKTVTDVRARQRGRADDRQDAAIQKWTSRRKTATGACRSRSTRAQISTSVDSLLNRLSQAQMKAIVSSDAEPSAKDLKTYGLDKPQLTLVVGAGSTRATFAIGGKKDDATLYARDLSKPIVFTVENGLVADLARRPMTCG